MRVLQRFGPCAGHAETQQSVVVVDPSNIAGFENGEPVNLQAPGATLQS